MKKSLKFLAVLLAAALLFTSCGDLAGMLGGLIPAADPASPDIELNGSSDRSVHYGDPVSLSVTASVNDGGTLSYQWWSGTTDNFNSASQINGATSASYSFTAGNAEAKKYYWCEVTNSLNGKISKDHSNSVYVKTSNVIVINDDIQAADIWYEDYTYWVKGDCHVYAKLTINEGTVVKFNQDGWLGARDNGKIIAEGTEDKAIIFTADTDDSVGISLAPYTQTGDPEAGYWEGLESAGANGSEFEYCEIRYAGSECCGALHLNKKTTVTNCTFHDNATPEHKIGALNITGEGIYSTVKDNVFYHNEWPLSCTTNYTVDTSNVFHKDVEGGDPLTNEHQAIYLETYDGTITSTQRGTKAVVYGVTEVPYLTGSFDVYGDLVIKDGVIVRFLDGCNIDVRNGGDSDNLGELTLEDGCILTSFQDDANGGDIFGDGMDEASDNDWDGIWTATDDWNNSYNNDDAKILFENPDHDR